VRLAGGDETLTRALREAGKAVMADLSIATSPNAEVYLDGEPLGKADAQGRFGGKAKLGPHVLKVSLEGKKDFQQNLTLAARQATKVQARLEDVGPTPGQVRENPKDGLKYVWIPPGTFTMGCSPGDNECGGDEKPAHQVTITKGFWIGQTPVTVGAYRRFAGTTGRSMPEAPHGNTGWANENMPIVNVTWDDGTAFCGWADGRLPTEAEWEYAARAGSTAARYGAIGEVAWYNGGIGGFQPHEVAQKRANGLGLYDMLGNVWEWVNDWYDPNYYHDKPAQDPTGPASGRIRVIRGGSWFDYASVVRVSLRRAVPPTFSHYTYGFRCDGEAGSP
jgi:formylglycine-generating enzyme required for sulfatase activity